MTSEGQSAADSPGMPDAWVDDHADAMFRFAMRRLGDSNVAEDLLQETFLAALKGKDGFRGESSVRTWLIGILRLKIADHFRQQARRRAREDAAGKAVAAGSHRSEALRGWTGNPEKAFEDREFWRTLRACLKKMPQQLASAYMLRELDHCSTDEICGLLKISATNLSVRIYRARALLRDCLDANWFHRDKRP